MYKVNGEFPSYSASLYTLENGDEVEWLYTRDLGKDVGGGWDSGTGGNAGDTTVKPAAKVSSGAAKASVTLDNMKEAIGNAKGSGEAWYAEPLAWALANDIVSGYGNGRFGPNDHVTREQMAAILHSYASCKGCDVTAMADLSLYTDGAAISPWAQSALSWANAEGFITGRTATTLAPGGSATRAEVAAILMRFVEGLAS